MAERQTRQRDAIRQAFDDGGRPMSVPEAHAAARRRAESLGIATVYRAVSDLVDEGFLQPVELPGQPVRYERADLPHHHHFQCNACQKVFDIEGCPGGIKAMLPDGFTLESHEVLMYGRCASCR